MATYIGTNDRETLIGAAEELRRAARDTRNAPLKRTKADRQVAEAVALTLEYQASFFETCAKNGPTPNMDAVRALHKANGLPSAE